MNINKLNQSIQKPAVYEKGDSVMWTDDHISKKLLELHLNPDIDAASRTAQSINKTIEFLEKYCDKTPMDILDIGCGPGIYTEKFAKNGHNVTGVDFSENSIFYAKKQAKVKNLSINYVCMDYLELDYENQFDLIMIIYTDFGVLLPNERKRFLENVQRALKPNGKFIFDVLNDKNIEEKFKEEKQWSFEMNGFWKESPFLELINGFHYYNEKVFLKQHTIIDETETISTYRFWTHYFNTNEINQILLDRGFINTISFENILPALNVWSGENVTFYVTEKKQTNYNG